jgi:hypothetical protein
MKLKILLTILIIFFVLIFYLNYENMTYVRSSIDNQYYLVRNLKDKEIAANMLAIIHQHILKFIEYLVSNKDNKDFIEYTPYIQQLQDNIGNIVIAESTSSPKYTSYSVNKGEQLVLCLRSRRDWNKFHDINLLMYVVLHEISHIACPEYDHTPLFKKIFAFFVIHSEKIGLYKQIDFKNNPEEYCGLTVNDNII